MPVRPVDLADLPLAAVLVDAGAILAATADAASLLARGRTDLAGTPLIDLFDDGDRDLVAGLLIDPVRRRADDDPPEPREVVARLAGGTAIGLRVSGRPGPKVVLLAERRREHLLAAIIDAVADSTLVLDSTGQLIWQSEGLARRVPTGPANIGTHPVDRLHPEDLPVVLEAFAKLAEGPNRRATQIVRSRAVDDDDIWQLIELVGASRVDDPDVGGVIVQVRNLDEGAEIASLARTEGPMLSLAEAAPVGILLMDRSGRVIYANRLSATLLDLGDGREMTGWREQIREPDRQVVEALVAAGLAGTAATTATVACAVPGDGTRWLRIRVAPHHDVDDQVVGVVVALEDVTAEVVARAESERLLRMLDLTSDFVAIFRPNGDILHVNSALRQVLERLAAEGASGRLRDLLGERGTERFNAVGASLREEADTWQGEFDINVGGGQLLPVSAVAMVNRDDAGGLDWIAMVARDVSAMKAAEEDLRQAATHDHLTGLANRALFTEQLGQALESSRRTGRTVALVFTDLDRFKDVNDQFGHAAGDVVLLAIADRLREITRQGDLAARVGGDEFVLLCEGMGDSDDLVALAERLITSVQRPVVVAGTEVTVGISVGVAVARDGAVDGDRLMITADQAMYRAKATGGNRYRIQDVAPGEGPEAVPG